MPCFHFNAHSELPSDRDGVNLPDIQAARTEAVRLAGAMLNEAPDRFWVGEEWVLDVTNCSGEVLFGLELKCFEGIRDATPSAECPDAEVLA